MKTKVLKLTDVLFDKETYPRHNPDFITIARYINAMKAGAVFPPITVAVLDKKYYLVDGMHRMKATKAIKQDHIDAEVITVKDKKEIYLEAVKRNIIHGHQFSTQEVVNITITLEKWNMSKAQIAEIVRIPTDKITSFVAKRAVRVIGGVDGENSQLALRKHLNHLAGSEQAVEFESEMDTLKGGASQKELIDNLIVLIENDWIDINNPEVSSRISALYKLLANIVVDIPEPEKKSRKKSKK